MLKSRTIKIDGTINETSCQHCSSSPVEEVAFSSVAPAGRRACDSSGWTESIVSSGFCCREEPKKKNKSFFLLLLMSGSYPPERTFALGPSPWRRTALHASRSCLSDY